MKKKYWLILFTIVVLILLVLFVSFYTLLKPKKLPPIKVGIIHSLTGTMSFEEHRFVDSCTTLLTFSPKQESWIRSLYARLKD